MSKKTIYWIVGIIVLLFIVGSFISGGLNWGMIYGNTNQNNVVNK